MSNFKEYLKVEIVKFSEDEQGYEGVNDLIEYVAEDAEFEAYEYIIEEASSSDHRQYQNNKFQLKSVDDGASGILHDPVQDGENYNLTIKLESDRHYHDFRERKYKCSNRKCKKEKIEFESQQELDSHNQEHRNQISHNECPICNKVLINQAKLHFHMDTRHIPKNFYCDNCGKVFRSKDNLRLHMSHHRKHFTVECKACKKNYKSMQSLRYHLRQHFEHHQCETCGQVFEHKKLLLGHIAAKHNHELMLQCRFCTRMFSRNDVREAHEREIHKNGQVGSHFKCNECECAFDLRDDLMSHKILNHYSGVIHTCEECGKHFKKKSLLDLHMFSHKEKSIQCDICKMMFTFTTGLAKHKKLGRCKGPAFKTPKDHLTKEEIARIAKEQLFEITVNPTKKDDQSLWNPILESEHVIKDSRSLVKKKPGRKRRQVKDEVKSDHEAKSAVVATELDAYRQNLSSEVIMSSSGRIIKRKLPQIFPQLPYKPINIPKKINVPFVCDRCGKAFDNRMKLVYHLNNHMKDLKHKCKGCYKSFGTLSSLRKHHAVAHKNLHFLHLKEKRFVCDECPKRYHTEFLLSQHKLSHANLKNQQCSLCAFATNSPYDLKNHVKRIHEAKKDFVCPDDNCGKAFKRKCDMENHRKCVHSKFKVYVKCPTCDIIVLEKGLQSHMINRHSDKALLKPFVCSICGKAERYEKNLHRHYEAVHEPTDRGVTYACSECPQTFYRRRELTAHSFDHYWGAIHECSECGNKYKSKKELTNHLYSHKCKEWPCPYCVAVFQTKSGRSKHIRKHNETETRPEIFELIEEASDMVVSEVCEDDE